MFRIQKRAGARANLSIERTEEFLRSLISRSSANRVSHRSSAQPRPATWSIRDGAWGVLSEVQTISLQKNIHDRAYLSIGVTSGIEPGPCGVSGMGDSEGIGAKLCRILDMNFREFLF